VRLVPATAAFGGAVIASRVSYAIAAHAVLDTYARHAQRIEGGIDAVVVACFGDPGLEALRELAPIPVIGLLEAAVTEAARGDAPYAVITAGAAWVPMLQERIGLLPCAALARGVFAIETTGLDVTRDPDRFTGRLQAAVDAAEQAGARAVILGGSALAGLGSRLSGTGRLVDPLEAAMAQVRPVQQAAGPHPAKSHPAGPHPAGPPAPAIAYQGLTPALADCLSSAD
jgi:Asp/Glu/hydantoin racemase